MLVYNTEKYGAVHVKEELSFAEIAMIVHSVQGIDDVCLEHMTIDMYLLKFLTDIEVKDELTMSEYDELFFKDGITEIVRQDIKNLDLLYKLIEDSKKIENQINGFLNKFADAMENVSKKLPSKKKMEELMVIMSNPQGQKHDN